VVIDSFSIELTRHSKRPGPISSFGSREFLSTVSTAGDPPFLFLSPRKEYF